MNLKISQQDDFQNENEDKRILRHIVSSGMLWLSMCKWKLSSLAWKNSTQNGYMGRKFLSVSHLYSTNEGRRALHFQFWHSHIDFPPVCIRISIIILKFYLLKLYTLGMKKSLTQKREEFKWNKFCVLTKLKIV